MRTAAKLGVLAAVAGLAAWLLRRGSSPEALAPAAGEPAGPEPAAEAAPASESASAEGVEGYCVRERKKVLIKDPAPTVTKNGREAVKGTCPDCGAAIFRFGRG